MSLGKYITDLALKSIYQRVTKRGSKTKSLKKYKEKDPTKYDIAEGILSRIDGGISSALEEPGNHLKLERAIEEALEDVPNDKNGYPDRQESALKVVKIIGTPSTPREYKIISDAYNCCRSEYTLYAIDALEKYLASGIIFTHEKPSVCGKSIEQQERTQLAGIYWQLGELYERAGDYDRAVTQYIRQLRADDSTQFPFLNLAEAYKKKNDLDKAISILEKAKKNPAYRKNAGHYRDAIDDHISELVDKKNRGYVFRPRAHKEFIPLS